MDNIKVAIRVRPLIQREIEANSASNWTIKDSSIIYQNASPSTAFKFDRVFEPSESNSVVYKDLCASIVESVMGGFNGTIFAYGQTSSGKTYTMTGRNGIMENTVSDVFTAIDNMPDKEFLIRVSYMEIYNETVCDLLDPTNKNVKIKEDQSGNVILNLKEIHIKEPSDVFSAIQIGERHRSIGETNMNKLSSRSHAIFRMIIESRMQDSDFDNDIIGSQLNLVDLAGSERTSQTAAVGERFKEARSINKSLLTLSQVISQLSEGKLHISYRDSKITRILQNSLGGNARTVIICNVTPASQAQTLSTLQFASSAKRIKNKPVINVVSTDDALLKRYHQKIEALSKKLEEMQNQGKDGKSDKLKAELKEKNKENEELTKQIKELKEKFIVSQIKWPPNNPMPNRRETWCFGRASRNRNLSLMPKKPLNSLSDLDEMFVDHLDPLPSANSRKTNSFGSVIIHSACQTTEEMFTLEDLENKFKDLSEEKEVMSNALTLLKKEYDELREFTVLEKQIHLNDITDNYEKLKVEKEQLQTTLTQSNSEVVKLQSQLDDALVKLSVNQELLDKYSEPSSSVKGNAVDEETNTSFIISSPAAVTTGNTGSSTNLSFEELNKNVKEINAKLSSSLSLLTEAGNQEGQPKVLSIKEEDYLEFKAKFETLNGILQSLLKEKKEMHHFLQQMLPASEKNLQQKDDVIHLLKEGLQNAQLKIRDYRMKSRHALCEMKSREQALSSEVGQKTQYNEKLLLANEALHKEVEGLKSGKQELFYKNEILEMEKKSLETELDRVRADQEEERSKIKDTLNDHHIVNQRLEDSHRAMEIFKKFAEENLNVLSSVVTSGDASCAELKLKIDSLMAEKEVMSTKHRNEKEELEVEMLRLKDSNFNHKQSIAELESNYQQLKEAHKNNGVEKGPRPEKELDQSVFSAWRLCSKCNTSEATSIAELQFKIKELQKENFNVQRDRDTFRNKLSYYTKELRRAQNMNNTSTRDLKLEPSSNGKDGFSPRKIRTLKEALVKPRNAETQRTMLQERAELVKENDGPIITLVDRKKEENFKDQEPKPSYDSECRQQ